MLRKVTAISAGDGATLTPAASSAAILSVAVPLPPEMIAPAWPMRLPGGAVVPAMKPATGFFMCCLDAGGRAFLGVAADLADHHHAVGVWVGVEQLEHVDEVDAADRIAADADAGRLADAERGELTDRLVGEGPGARHDAELARPVDVPRHDADLARARA